MISRRPRPTTHPVTQLCGKPREQGPKKRDPPAKSKGSNLPEKWDFSAQRRASQETKAPSGIIKDHLREVGPPEEQSECRKRVLEDKRPKEGHGARNRISLATGRVLLDTEPVQQNLVFLKHDPMGNRTGACATPPVEGKNNCVPATPSASLGRQGLGNPMGETDGLPRKIAESDPLPE